jgi:hypothetical protein
MGLGEISELPIIPNELIFLIISFLDHKTLSALRSSVHWVMYAREINKIAKSPFRLRCYKLGDICSRCYILHTNRNRYEICETCWKKCYCGEIVNTNLFKMRCAYCKVIFCKGCLDNSIIWKKINRRDSEYETCRDCCEQYCFTCGETYDYDTASKCNKCHSIYCDDCDNGICYNCGIFYMESLVAH